MQDEITDNLIEDGIDRRGFLKCMAWAGTGLLFTVKGGIPKSFNLSKLATNAQSMAEAKAALAQSSFSFVQISDSHIGFSKEANKDVLGTLQAAIDKINASNPQPDLLIHTGDLSHLSKDAEFDALDQMLSKVGASERHFIPGEHDVLVENGKNYRERFSKEAKGDGWYSFDHKGVHFVALVNVMNLKPGGLGQLGEEQLAWLASDLKGLSNSTPIVVFAHVPLWEVYPAWGWGTDDGARALEMLKRFGSVTVLNGHIHQTVQKVEGNMTFHTACSTAFPQPKPGMAKGPGPMLVPANELRNFLGLTMVTYAEHDSHLAIIDDTLAAPTMQEVGIDNFTYSPATLTVKQGATVKWTNRDDIPHTVTANDGSFGSKTLDTNDTFTMEFSKVGRFPYYCKLHAHMTGLVNVV